MTKDYVVSLAADALAELLISRLTRPETQVAFASDVMLVDKYRLEAPACTVINLVFRTWFVRIRGFVTLVVTLSDEAGETKVHVATGGHAGLLGEGIAFVKTFERALQPYVVAEGK